MTISAGFKDISKRALHVIDKIHCALPDQALESAGWVYYKSAHNEVNQLKGIFNELSFSQNYIRRSAAIRKQVIVSLCQDKNFPKNDQQWQAMNMEQRQSLLSKIIKDLQLKFSDNGRLFPPKALSIRFRAEDGKAADQSGEGGDQLYLKKGGVSTSMTDWRCTVFINIAGQAGFNELFTALETAYHEALHPVHFALGDYYPLRDKKQSHLLADDMEMLYYAKGLSCGFVNRVLPLYHALPIEHDAHHQSRKFINDLRLELHKRDQIAKPS